MLASPTDMSELRFNVLTKEWVIIAPERANRPRTAANGVPASGRRYLPGRDPTCPFCPDNESQTAPELFRIAGEGSSGWRTRVVTNLFPALSRDVPDEPRRHQVLHHSVVGYGAHEVIVESPRHDLPIARLPEDQVQAIFETYLARYRAAQADPRIAHIILFKNHGRGAGTTLTHPHSQLVGTPVVSHQVRERIRTMEDHVALFGECIVCRMLAEEIADGTRVVHLSERFVAVIPYAALSAYHVWIFPRRHCAWFGNITPPEVRDLASTMRTVLAMMYHGLDDPDFNYIVRSAPRSSTDEEFHWYVSIIPRIASAAGFELGSGMYVNTALPEESAEFLRAVRLPALV